jgi:hypothetical protein
MQFPVLIYYRPKCFATIYYLFNHVIQNLLQCLFYQTDYLHIIITKPSKIISWLKFKNNNNFNNFDSSPQAAASLITGYILLPI